MAKQIIDIGTAADDGTGDPHRTAFAKANGNFNELYAADAALDSRVDALETSGAPPTYHAATHAAGGADPVTLATSQVTGLDAALAAKAPLAVPISTRSGTTYTLALSDAGSLVRCDNAGAIGVTVPANASAAFPIGSKVALSQAGAGQVTVAGASGVTVNTSAGGTLKTAGQFAVIEVVKVATDTWLLYGDRAAAA